MANRRTTDSRSSRLRRNITSSTNEDPRLMGVSHESASARPSSGAASSRVAHETVSRSTRSASRSGHGRTSSRHTASSDLATRPAHVTEASPSPRRSHGTSRQLEPGRRASHKALDSSSRERTLSSPRPSRSGRTASGTIRNSTSEQLEHSSKTARAKRPSIKSKKKGAKQANAETQKSLDLETSLPDTDAVAIEDTDSQGELVSTSVGELRREERAERMRKSSRQYLIRLFAIAVAIAALVGGGIALYNSPAFTISNVRVVGVEHLTSDEMAQLANVPADSTLLRVDADAIASRVKQSSWVENVQVNRVFPDTLEIDVTERSIFAVVEMPNESGTSTKRWAIAPDRTWLMPIPDASSEAAQTTSSKIYEDADSAIQIVGLPFGTNAEIGQTCSDVVVNNALDILQEMTTDLAGHVVKVSAASIAETSLFLDNGMEIAFGTAEDIRDKERAILKIMETYPDGVAYINVRMVDNPTWRSI